MRKVFEVSVFVTSLLFLGCGEQVSNEVYYTYEDMVVKRIDQNNKTTLFYMENGVPIDTIWTTYSGLTDSWFDGNLYFLEDGKVLVSGFWHRHQHRPYMFKILKQDYPSYFNEQIICGKVHVTSTPELGEMTDSLIQQGRMYRIVLTDPKKESEIFNKENPNTKVQTLKQYPQ